MCPVAPFGIYFVPPERYGLLVCSAFFYYLVVKFSSTQPAVLGASQRFCYNSICCTTRTYSLLLTVFCVSIMFSSRCNAGGAYCYYCTRFGVCYCWYSSSERVFAHAPSRVFEVFVFAAGLSISARKAAPGVELALTHSLTHVFSFTFLELL